MNHFFSFEIFSIVLVIVGTGLLLTDLYGIYHHGKFILKLKESGAFSIFGLISLIIWGIATWYIISDYIYYEKNSEIKDILRNIFWIEFSISNIIKSLRSSEIRENGIYQLGYFYKWSKFQSYSFVSPNTIQFKVNTIFKTNSSFEITIKEELKLKVDEVLQEKIA